MKYYACFRRKNHVKETIYKRNVSNLNRIKLEIETIYRWQDVGNLLDDVVEWRIYDKNKNLLEVGIVESTVKGKEVSWNMEV